MHLVEQHTVIHPRTLTPEDWLRFVQIDPFPKQWAKCGLTDDDLRALEVSIMAIPNGWPVIPGTNGLRKIRFASDKDSRGKSSSFRIIYIYFVDFGTVLLLAVFSKNDQADLSISAKQQLSALVTEISKLLERGAIK